MRPSIAQTAAESNHALTQTPQSGRLRRRRAFVSSHSDERMKTSGTVERGAPTEDGTIKMAQLVVMYKTPQDAAAFDRHYFEKHVPLAKKIPGVKKYDVSQGPVVTPGGSSGYRLIATLQFDDVAAIQKGFASAEGRAAVADLQTFATGGADIIMFDSRPA
jgi:uncharacterized protein (TIGR02118 family)